MRAGEEVVITWQGQEALPAEGMLRFGRLLAIGFLSGALALGQSAPPAITTQPVSQTAVAGGNVTFSVAATGAEPILYRWYKDGVEISGATGPSLTLRGVQPRDAGAYQASVINAANQIQAVSAGYDHSMFLKADGSLWGMGSNANGQLGDGTTTLRSSPLQVARGVASISAGDGYTMFIKSDGTLWGMGLNGGGHLGDGTTTNRLLPVPISSGVAGVSAAYHHTLFMKSDGTLWGMGASWYLGVGTNIPLRTTPALISSGVAGISAGSFHSMFLKADGSLWGTGANQYYALGDGTSIDRYTPVRVAVDVASVSAGASYTTFIKTNGTLWGMGANSDGALGLPTRSSQTFPVQLASGVAKVSAGSGHTLFIRTDGALWGMGDNTDGQLGDGSTFNRFSSVRIDGGVASVSAGGYHTIYVKTDGTLWGMGGNDKGQLGDGSQIDRTKPVRITEGGLLSSTASLTVNSPPSITSQPVSQSVIEGLPLRLSVAASGTPALTFQWRKFGSDIPGATNATFSIAAAGRGDTGAYSVLVTNAVGGVVSSEAVITVTPSSPAAITVQPANVAAEVGQSAILSVAVTGSPAPAIQWLRNGLALPGATGSSLVIGRVASADAASYSVTVQHVYNGTTYSLTSAPARLTLAANPLPYAITVQPAELTVWAGQAFVLSARGAGPSAPTFQWRKDGVSIPGATSATYSVAAARSDQAGTYTVVVSGGSVSVTSSGARVGVLPSRLVNLSILTALDEGELLTLGTVLGGPGTSGAKALLIRGAGPSLEPLGVTGFLPDPKLDLYRGQSLAATNDNWGGSSQLTGVFTAAGAFAYSSAASRDAAIHSPGLAVGGYTVQIRGEPGTAGTLIAELYDATPAPELTAATPRLVNVSVLKSIREGDSLTAGFVIGGMGTRRVLIRAVGPALGLAPFNIGGVMSDPKLTLYAGQQVIAVNDNWGSQSAGLTATQITATADGVGAFRIGDASSRDAVLLLTLNPGNYTAQVAAASGGGGFVITEVYEVP
jgi:alpha-tubulin suppressor-like RCC1 family protein